MISFEFNSTQQNGYVGVSIRLIESRSLQVISKLLLKAAMPGFSQYVN